MNVDTPHGVARIHLRQVDDVRGWLALGHGAGGGVSSGDLTAAADAAHAERFGVALVEQPYRVQGRRSQPPAHHLDSAWLAVVERLRGEVLEGLPLVTGGRSAGARVACRTAAATEAIGVVCLAFPLVPPRRAGGKPAPSRLPELEAVSVPTLVIQGDRDRFGMPPARGLRTVVQVAGDHSLRTDLPAVEAAVRDWLDRLVG
jgi:predicted alpha/beta-hydrolase family hydrolase